MVKIGTDFINDQQKPLVLIVNPEIGRLDEVQEELQSKYKFPLVSIGKSLSGDLIAGKLASIAAAQAWLNDQVRNISSDTILLSDIDFLFEPSFHLDPLMLFQRTSRFKHLIVLWPGTVSSNRVLAYAVPEHSHYRTWRNPDADILAL